MRPTIVLCGFMGSGKTTVGRIVARYTDRNYIDMDEYIEKKSGLRVAEIFEQFGEPYFRALEHAAARKLAAKKEAVVAVGGGALIAKENVDAFHTHGCKIIFLDASLEHIRKRLSKDKSRPLLNRGDRETAMQELLQKRRPFYLSAADITVNADAGAEETAVSILYELGEWAVPGGPPKSI